MENNQANAGQGSLLYVGEGWGCSRGIAMWFALHCSAGTACSLAVSLEFKLGLVQSQNFDIH